MLRFVFSAILINSVFSAPPAPIKWPEFLEPCATSNPDYDQCSKRKLQFIFDKYNGGIPELGVASFDPLYISEILHDFYRGVVEGKVLVRNTKCYGLKNTEILDVRTNMNDPTNMTFYTDFHIPSIFIEGEYKAEGKIVAFPISGKGVYNISMNDVKGTWSVYGDMVQINDVEYMKVRHVYMYPEVGDMKVYASNLFTGNQELNKAALRFANNYWSVFYKEMLPYVVDAWDKYMRGVLNKVFLKLPFKTIFPENR